MSKPELHQTTRRRVTVAELEPEVEARYYESGKRAGYDGLQADDCPYEPMTAAALAWLSGWVQS